MRDIGMEENKENWPTCGSKRELQSESVELGSQSVEVQGKRMEHLDDHHNLNMELVEVASHEWPQIIQ